MLLLFATRGGVQLLAFTHRGAKEAVVLRNPWAYSAQNQGGQIVQRFGTDLVAEVTGRSRRIVRKGEGHSARLVVENRAGAANLAETQAFMDDEKRILIFSDAGGTGRSYHADLGAKNQRLRVHYLLEPGWKADAAIQGLGRTNRTNQAQPPLFRRFTTLGWRMASLEEDQGRGLNAVALMRRLEFERSRSECRPRPPTWVELPSAKAAQAGKGRKADGADASRGRMVARVRRQLEARAPA